MHTPVKIFSKKCTPLNEKSIKYSGIFKKHSLKNSSTSQESSVLLGLPLYQNLSD